jgi:hypothetical protein
MIPLMINSRSFVRAWWTANIVQAPKNTTPSNNFPIGGA